MQKRKKNISEEEMTAVYNQIDATETKIKELEQKSHEIRQQIASCEQFLFYLLHMKNIIPILCCLFLLALIIISANENTELKKQIDTLYENKTTACYSFNEDLEMKIN